MNNKTFNEVYQNLIYEFNKQKLIDECSTTFKIDSVSGKTNECLYPLDESQYFSDVPQSLEDYVFDQFKSNVFKEGFVQIPISEFAKHIDKQQIKNFRNFHDYLDILKQNNIGTVTLKIDNYNYYEPPINFNKFKVRCLDNNIDYENIEQQYCQYLNIRKNSIKSINQLYTLLKDKTLHLDDFGTIAIKPYEIIAGEKHQISDQQLRINICHEVTHLLTFLIRISGTNHDICMYYGRKPINDFVENNGNIDIDELNNYLNDPNEFKAVSETYISRLICVFDSNHKNKNKCSIITFLKSIFLLCGVNKRFVGEFDEISYSTFQLNSFKMFVQTIFNDSQFKNNNYQNYKSRNKWKIFKKWLIHSFNKHFFVDINIDNVFEA